MIDIEAWCKDFLQALEEAFPDRVCFVGLQGSYGRGEATDSSDIDMVVIFDELSDGDIQRYSALLDNLPNRELTCGFLSGRNELMHWEVSDLFQFYHDTIPIKGSLDNLLPQINEAAVNKAIKIGVCNIYHACVHNLIYEKDKSILKGLYKSASFVVQAVWYKQSGEYVKHQQELLKKVNDKEKKIVSTFLNIKNDETINFEEASNTLFQWSKHWISKLG